MPTISAGILTRLADSFYRLDNQLRIEVTKSAEIFILQAGKDVFDDRWWQVGGYLSLLRDLGCIPRDHLTC